MAPQRSLLVVVGAVGAFLASGCFPSVPSPAAFSEHDFAADPVTEAACTAGRVRAALSIGECR